MTRLISLLIAFLIAESAFAQTQVCGNISGTWTLAGSPYYVTCDVTVPQGQTLVIQPGVSVLFQGQYRFIVGGNLQAIGTFEDSVLFSRAFPTEESKWSGIRFIDSANDGSRLAFCVIEYCIKGSGNDWDTNGGGIHLDNSSPTISNCTIRYNQGCRGAGICLFDGCTSVLKNCVIYGNNSVCGLTAAWISNAPATIENCTVADNIGGDIGTSIAASIRNCICWSQTPVSGDLSATYCDIRGGRQGTGNLDADPLFVDPGFGDYRLQQGSPCLNTGDPNLPQDPDGTRSDIGAFLGAYNLLALYEPNGNEIWEISSSETLRWASSTYSGNVQIELNRSYSGGIWEVIAQNTLNDGVETWLVTGPASRNCRVRISLIGDTLDDMSDSDFIIQPFIELISPSVADMWGVFQADTVRWIGGGFEGVSISLNRHYPIGPWEAITSSTENDGEYEWFVTDPLSDSCRIRICAVQDTFCDVSNGNFSIVSSQGYLALVKSSAPNSPVLNWNAGITECPASQNEWFRLKNFGSEAVVVFQPLEPTSNEFSRTTACGSFFALAPNQMSACSMQLSFSPSSDGNYFDTLRVQTDAVNGVGGYVKIPLAGTQISTPAPAQVVITTQGSSARLMWNPVTESLGECPVTVTHYLVFYSPTEQGPYYYHGLTSDTTYVHMGVIAYAPAMFYTVTPMTGAIPILLRDIEPGEMTREDVMEKIPIYKFQFTVQK